MNLKSVFLGAVAAASIAIPVAVVAPASAAATAGCSGHGCDGQPPGDTGCYKTQTIVETVNVGGSRGVPKAGKLQLLYSRACKTVWTEMLDTYDPNGIGWLTRNSDHRREKCIAAGYQKDAGGYMCGTYMLYDVGTTSYAGGDWGRVGKAADLRGATKSY